MSGGRSESTAGMQSVFQLSLKYNGGLDGEVASSGASRLQFQISVLTKRTTCEKDPACSKVM